MKSIFKNEIVNGLIILAGIVAIVIMVKNSQSKTKQQ